MAYLSPDQLMNYENAEKRRHPAIFGEAPSSVQLGPIRLDQIYLDQLRAVSSGSRYIELEQTYSLLNDELLGFRALAGGWDSYRAPAPLESAIQAAERGLRALRAANAKPSAILPSADGGVGVCFINGDHYGHIEFTNTGETWVLMYGPVGTPESFQLLSSDEDSLKQGWSRISAHLQR